MIEQLIAALYSLDMKPTAEEIADIVWLSGHINSDAVQRYNFISGSQEQKRTASTPTASNFFEEQRRTQSKHKPNVSDIQSGGADLFAEQNTENQTNASGISARRFRSPAATGLSEPLILSRTLRPLNRRVNSSTQNQLDEESTVRAIADERKWLPVVRPAPERWLDAVLLVDEWSSMTIWHQTALDVSRLLTQLGAFRSIESWGIDYDPSINTPRLRANLHADQESRRVRQASELLDPQGRRIILVLTDCISPAWYDGSLARLLTSTIQQRGMLVIIQLLPPQLWRRTGLADIPQVFVRSRYPGTPNQELEIGPPERYLFEDRPTGLIAPIITLEQDTMKLWAKLIAGIGGQWIPGAVFPLTQVSIQRETVDEVMAKSTTIIKPTAQRYIDHFVETASPTARELAGYLAAVPLILPVMRLVQRVMLPRSRQIHLAEVFLSGLLERQTPLNRRVKPNEIMYNFVEGVRELLLDTVRLSDTKEVLLKISDYVNERSGQQFDFQALLADPTATGDFILNEETKPFASVAAVVLRRMGGRYAELAQNLEAMTTLKAPPAYDNILFKESVTYSPNRYIDFDLDLRNHDGQHYLVTARSIIGEVNAVVTFPFTDAQLENHLLRLENAILRSVGRRHVLNTEEERIIQTFGQQLFDFLLADNVRALYYECLREANRQRQGVRLRLHIHPPALALLPWEFLFDPRRSDYLCLDPHTPLVRYLDLPQAVQTLSVAPPLRILGIVAAPADLQPLNVAEEQANLERALQDLIDRSLVELTWLAGDTWRDLQRAMRTTAGPWHIVHFIGHGSFDSTRGEGVLYLADEERGSRAMGATQLSRLLAGQRFALRLVVLNACEGARGGQADILSSTAATLVSGGLPAVLAMQYDITDVAAIEFAQSFYEALADGLPVDTAVAEARNAVSLANRHSLEWGVPVLYMRSSNSQLFELSPP